MRRSIPNAVLKTRAIGAVALALVIAFVIAYLAGRSSPLLRWAPPRLVDPATVNVESGLDPDVLNLSTSEDYFLKLPPTGIHGTVEINGGHNVVLIGGSITVPSTANQTDNGADHTDTAIYVHDSTGTVHIEGVVIKADPYVMFDGIDVNAPQAIVQVENVRMEDVYGSYSMEHADVIQTWGGAKDLRVDRLTADGDYQGLQIDPDLGRLGSAEIQNVDLTDDARPSALASETIGGQIMIWLTGGTTTCDSAPVSFSNVYLSNDTDRITSGDTVWPATDSGLSCNSVLQGNQISWPKLPVTGSVTFGTPPNGPYVPLGVAGTKYLSPGYRDR